MIIIIASLLQFYVHCPTCSQVPFFVAARQGDLAALQEIITRSPGGINQTDKTGMTALHFAAYAAQHEAVRLLLQKGADPNLADYQGATPLHFAAEVGDLESIRLLLNGGAAVDACDKGGASPLAVAAEYNRLPAMTLLMDSGASLGLCSGGPPRLSPLHLAAKNGQVGSARMLIDRGADVNLIAPDRQNTPLQAAMGVYNRKTDVVEYLLEHGANPNMKDIDGNTPLHWACYELRPSFQILLLAHGANPFILNKKGLIPAGVSLVVLGKIAKQVPTNIKDEFNKLTLELFVP